MSSSSTRRDTQQVELFGRSRLIDELVHDGLEVALPLRDRGVDFVAYADLSPSVERFVARPIQMKTAWTSSFVIERKYERIHGLILAYVWYLGDRERATTFAMSYAESIQIGDAMGWTTKRSWVKGKYSTTSPPARLREFLEPYRMSEGKWWRLVTT